MALLAKNVLLFGLEVLIAHVFVRLEVLIAHVLVGLDRARQEHVLSLDGNIMSHNSPTARD